MIYVASGAKFFFFFSPFLFYAVIPFGFQLYCGKCVKYRFIEFCLTMVNFICFHCFSGQELFFPSVALDKTILIICN